ncbi:MAG: hypothetical protein ACRDPJ_20905 [Nocardioidaceae bacterium]
MRRRTFDALLTVAGLILATVLVAAGGLLTWANGFIEDQVTTQLSAQKIYFPEAGSESAADPAVKEYVEPYLGQQLTTGEQARVYADHYIKAHIDAMTGGKTYSELSTASRANPDDQELAGMVQTTFRGETLRGLLLNAYAFWQMGQIALYGAIAAFAAAALMLVLSVLGMLHLRRVPVEQEVRLGRGVRTATA